MKFIKYETIFEDGALNVSHIVELRIQAAFDNGRPIKDTWGVVAQLSFGQGTRIIFVGSAKECETYVDNFVKGV